MNELGKYDLPTGWRWSTIPELVGNDGVFIDGDWVESKDQDPDGDVRLIQLADVGDGVFRDKSDRFMTRAKAEELRCTFLQTGDVLIARMPDPLGRACIFPGDDKQSVTVVDVAIARSGNGEFDHRWLANFVNAHPFRAAISGLQAGSTRKRISRGNLGTIPLPVPPLKEQRRIVAEIEKQVTRLDAGISALRRTQANLKRYRAAVLKAACEGRLVPTKTAWPQTQIATAILTMDQGWSPKCESEPSSSDANWAVIKTTAIQNLHFLEKENKALPEALKPREHLELESGDLLVTRAGPRNRVGVACLVKHTRPRLMLCDKAYRLRCNPSVAHPAFLELVLNAPHIVDELNKLKTGISDSGLNLTQKRFGELLVPLPPLTEQTRIVAEVERRLSMVEELETVVSANLQRATRLRQSILSREFSQTIKPPPYA